MKRKYFSLLTLLISLLFVVMLYPKLQHPNTFRAFIYQLGWLGIFVDLLVIMLLALFPVIPFILAAGVNILLYGWTFGFILSLTGSLLGASVGFGLARSLGQGWAQPKIGKLGKWGTLIESNHFSIIFVSRLIPILPSAAVNYAAGLSLMSYPKFLLATILGKAPMILWESWVGHDLWHLTNHPGRLLLGLGVGALLFGLIGLYWYSRMKTFESPELTIKPEKQQPL